MSLTWVRRREPWWDHVLPYHFLCDVWVRNVLAASNRKSNSWINHKNLYLPIMFRGRQFQDCPGSSTKQLSNFLLCYPLSVGCSSTCMSPYGLKMTAVPIQGRRRGLHWYVWKAGLSGAKEKELGNIAIVQANQKCWPQVGRGCSPCWDMSYTDDDYYLLQLNLIGRKRKFLQDAGNEFFSSVSFPFSGFQVIVNK